MQIRYNLCILVLLWTTQCSTGNLIFQQVDDRSITAQVVGLLIQDLSINHLDIKVITDEGEVFLIGRVSDFDQRLRAEMHARSVANVWSVINLLETGKEYANSELARQDLAIQTRLFTRFTGSGNIPLLNLSMHCFEKEVYLIGRLSDNQSREKLLQLARNTEDVAQVHNYLKAGRRP